MYDWLTDHKIPLGVWLRSLVDGLTTNAQGLFDAISLTLGTLIDGLTAGLEFIPPFVFIALVAAGAWFLHRSIGLVVFAVLSLGLMWLDPGHRGLFWVGVGMATYGVLYFVAHDGLVHRRWPFHWVPRRGYMQRLYQAHRLHHAVEGKEGCVSFGFLYAPPVRVLKQRLQEQRGRTPRDAMDAATDPAHVAPLPDRH